MNTIHRLPDRAGAEQDAGAWIARLHADDVSPEDLERFKAWCESHPRHARIYEEMSGTIDEVKRAGRIVRAVSFGNAMNAAASYTPLPATGEGGAPGDGRARVLALAASLLVALGTALFLFRNEIFHRNSYTTAIGERATVELPDGSRLDLNSHSTARVAYDDTARTIYLTQGEAYFKVARDPQRPFRVIAGNSLVRALGTAFNIDMRASSVRVIVTEGTVSLDNNPIFTLTTRSTEGKGTLSPSPETGEGRGEVEPGARRPTSESALLLTAGQQAEMKSGSAQIRAATPNELTRLTAWRSGKLYYENQPLESVIEELSRYTNDTITVEDEALRQLPIGGTFLTNPQGVEALLGMLQAGFDLRVRKENDGHIYIEGPHGQP